MYHLYSVKNDGDETNTQTDGGKTRAACTRHVHQHRHNTLPGVDALCILCLEGIIKKHHTWAIPYHDIKLGFS